MQDAEWVVLFRDADLARVHMVATSILAMEFDARIVDAATGRAIPDDPDERTTGAVLVRAGDAAALHEVLDDLVDEQDEFDASVEARAERESRLGRLVFFAVLLAAVVILLVRWSRSGT